MSRLTLTLLFLQGTFHQNRIASFQICLCAKGGHYVHHSSLRLKRLYQGVFLVLSLLAKLRLGWGRPVFGKEVADDLSRWLTRLSASLGCRLNQLRFRFWWFLNGVFQGKPPLLI